MVVSAEKGGVIWGSLREGSNADLWPEDLGKVSWGKWHSKWDLIGVEEGRVGAEVGSKFWEEEIIFVGALGWNGVQSIPGTERRPAGPEWQGTAWAGWRETRRGLRAPGLENHKKGSQGAALSPSILPLPSPTRRPNYFSIHISHQFFKLTASLQCK